MWLQGSSVTYAVGAPGAGTRGAQRQDLRMRLARPHMPALAQYPVVPYHHAADSRIRIGGVEAAGGKLQRSRHVRLVPRRRGGMLQCSGLVH